MMHAAENQLYIKNFIIYGVIDDDRTNKDRNAEQTRWLKWPDWRWPEKWNTTGALVNIPKVLPLLPWHLVFVILFTNSCLLIHGLSKSYTVNVSGFCVCSCGQEKRAVSFFCYLLCLCCSFFLYLCCVCVVSHFSSRSCFQHASDDK